MTAFDTVFAMQKLLLEAQPPQDYWIVFPSDKAVRLLKEQDAMAERISVLESALAAIIEANDRGWGEEFIRAIDDAKLLLEPQQ